MNIKNYISGNFSKNQLTHFYIPVMLLLIGFDVLIAWLFFPVDLNYNIIDRAISNLGSRLDNPIGSVFFSIGIIAWGVLLIPWFLYVHKRLVKVCKYTSRLGTVCALIGSIFIPFIGIFSDDDSILIFGTQMSEIHLFVATVGIGGLGLGVLTYILPILKDSFFKRGNRQFSLILVFIAYGLIYYSGIGAAIAAMIKEAQNYEWPGPGLFSINLWEWTAMLAFWIYIPLLSYAIPEEIKELKEK